MGAFQAGFGMGMQAWDSAQAAKERAADRERQTRLDAEAAQDRDLNRQLTKGKLDEQNRLLKEEAGLRQAGATEVATPGFSSGAAGSRVFSADQGNAQAVADIDNAAREMEGSAPASVTPATGVTGGKPRIGATGMQVDNSLEGRVKRRAEYLHSIGQPERAQKIELEHAEFGKKLYDAQRSALYGSFTKTLYSGGAAEAVKLYDGYNDGFTADLQESGAGGAVIKRDKEGREVGRLTYKDRDDLAMQVKRAIFPDQYLDAAEKARMEAAAKVAENASKVHTVGAGGMAVRGDGKVLATNNNGYVQDGTNEDGTPRLIKSGTTRADHFDAKQWDQAARIDKAVVSLYNPLTDKESEDGNLRSAYMQVFNAAKASGSMAPNQAAEHATTTVVRLKNAAADRVEKARKESPDSTLTIQQAVRDIVKEAGSFRPTSPAPGQGTGSQASGGQRVDPQIQRERDVESGVALVREYGSLARAEEGAAMLRTEIGRTSGEGRTILQSELNRLMLGIEAARQGAKPTTQQPKALSQPAKEAAPSESSGPNLASRVGSLFNTKGGLFNPGERLQLQARIDRSLSGGAPLSADDQARAKQLGLIR